MDMCASCRLRTLLATVVWSAVVMVTIVPSTSRARTIQDPSRLGVAPDPRQWYRDFMRGSVRQRVHVWRGVPRTGASTDRTGQRHRLAGGMTEMMNDAGTHNNDGNLHGNDLDPRINDKGHMTEEAVEEVVRDTDFSGFVCRPRPLVVDVRRPRDMNMSAIYFPTCVAVTRCGGCCTPGYSCRPTVHEYKSVKLQVYEQHYGGEKYLAPYTRMVKVKSHTFCACQLGTSAQALRSGRRRNKRRRTRHRKPKRGAKN